MNGNLSAEGHFLTTKAQSEKQITIYESQIPNNFQVLNIWSLELVRYLELVIWNLVFISSCLSVASTKRDTGFVVKGFSKPFQDVMLGKGSSNFPPDIIYLKPNSGGELWNA